VQQCGEVKFNQQLCKLLADIYMNSMDDLDKYLLNLDRELDAGFPDLCEQVLAELCRLMCYGERLAKDWANEYWWRSMVNLSNSVSVGKKVEIHLKEFLSCVKVLKIAIAEAGCKFKLDLPTILDSELPMSHVQQASDCDRETLLQHINACLELGNSNNDYNLAKHLEQRSIPGQFFIKFDNVDVHGNEGLGEGSFGAVFKCEFLQRTAAAKVFRHPQNTSRKDVENEVNLLAKLQHPNVVQFIGYTFKETQEVIVLELMREDLERYLASRMAGNEGRPPLPLLGAVDVMLQIAHGMNYLHESHVMHRDLKARNVLISVVKDDENLELSWSRHVKIADFGLSKLKENSQFTTMDMGTTPWRAPEVFDQEDNKDMKYTKAADVYSFAMVFFEVLTGKTPFSDVLRKELYKEVCRGKRPALPSKAYCPVYLSAFIRRCWATKPEERPEFPKICQMLVYCKELILRDSFPSPLNCIVENDVQKLSSFLGQNLCIEEGLKGNMPIHAYSFTVFHACDNGDHVPDHIKGMDWIQEQVKAGKHFGNWISQWQDFDKAFKLFSNAAKQKNLEAQYRLGLCFEHGLGTEQNHEKAVELYQLAIQRGYSCAYVELGCCYALGRGVAQSDHEASIMLQRAFEQQTSAGILLPCITEILQYMDSSKHPDATRPSAILEMYQKGYRRALHRVLLITKFPIGRKLLAAPSLNDNQEVDIISVDVHELKSKATISERSLSLEIVGFLVFSLFVVTSLLSVQEVQHFFVALYAPPFLFSVQAAQDFRALFLSRYFSIVLFSFDTVGLYVVFCLALTSTVFAVWVCVQWAITLLKARSPPDSTTHHFHVLPPVSRLVTNSYLCLPTCVGFLLCCMLMFWSWPTAWLILQCSTFYFVIRSCILCSDFLSESFSTNMLRFCKASILNNWLKSNTILDWWLNLGRAVGALQLLTFSTFVVTRASLFLVLHLFSLFHSCSRAVLLFVRLCFSESVRVILFSFQASTHFVTLHFFEIVLLMWASLVLGPHFSSLFGSSIQSVLHFVALCFSELGAMIPFSLQLTIKLMLLLLELVPFAFTVTLFLQ
jgi:serine/threonine protein kinase